MHIIPGCVEPGIICIFMGSHMLTIWQNMQFLCKIMLKYVLKFANIYSYLKQKSEKELINTIYKSNKVYLFSPIKFTSTISINIPKRKIPDTYKFLRVFNNFSRQ